MKKAMMKRSEYDVTRRRVTLYSKRSRNLLRKAHKISALCDAHVAFVAFSPSGLANTKFSTSERIDGVLQQYVDLPAYQRYYNLKDVEEKLERLSKLDHIINGEENKLHYLSNQIHHLELQIKKSEVEIEILDANLRNYEVEAEHTLPQLLWCERNLNQALQRVIQRKNLLLGNCSAAPSNGRQISMPQRRAVLETADRRPKLDDALSHFSSGGNELINRPTAQFPNHSELIMKLDPWISPYSSKVRKSMLREIINGFHPAGNGTGQSGESSFISSALSMEKNMTDFNVNPRFVPTAQHSKDASELPKEYPSSHYGIPFEAEVGNEGFCSTGNHLQEKEEGSLEWDGFLLAENLNLDDLDIII